MSKLRFCLKTSCWLFMGLAVALPIRADTSSMVFCEMANSCVILNKDDPNFDSIFENTVENVLWSTIEATIISVTPMKLPQGSTVEVTVTAPNAHFNTGSIGNVSVGEGAITVNPGGTVLSPTKIRLSVTVPSNLAPGFYDITVTTELSDKTEVAAGKAVLQVVAPSGNPEILGITPSNVPKPLSNYVLSVYGQNTHFSDASVIDFGTGITGTVKTVHNDNFMEVYVNVTSNAQKGIHNVKVTTGDEVAKNTQVGIFWVVDGSSLPPGIMALAPQSGRQRNTLDVTITGSNTNFSSNSTVEFQNDGIEVLSQAVVSKTQITATIKIAPETTLGLYDVQVTTGSETVSFLKGFTVSSAATVSLDNVQATQGKEITLQITGENTHFTQESSHVKLGTGITVSEITVSDSTTLTATISIDDNAETSTRDVFVVTGGEETVQLAAFTVQEKIPGEIKFSQENYSVNENASTSTFTVQRFEGSDGEATVNYETSNGSATSGDFKTTNGTFTWSDGESGDKTFTVDILNDSEFESDETFTITLTDTAGISLDTATVKIVNDDSQPVSNDSQPSGTSVPNPGQIQFSQENYEVSENAGDPTITVQRLGGSDGEMTVNYETSNGSATAGNDFEATSGTIIWGDKESGVKELTLNIVDDNVVESDETFTLELTEVTGGASLGPVKTATLLIVDDDVIVDTDDDDSDTTVVDDPVEADKSVDEDEVDKPVDEDELDTIVPVSSPPPVVELLNPGKIQFSQDNSDRVNENAGSYTVTVQRLNGTDGEVSVTVETRDGIKAISGQDFEAMNQTLTWYEGESGDKTLSVNILNDVMDEGDEVFKIQLKDVTGNASLGQKTLMVTIVDDDVKIDPDNPVAQVRICPESGEVRGSCSAKGVTITDLTVAENAHIYGGTLNGNLENKGQVIDFIIESGSVLKNDYWVSNLTIKPEVVLIGGILTGYIINEGTLVDIDFRGAYVIGGYLEGTIFNNSKINGYFEDVSFKPNTRIIGGALKGEIEGEPQYPALLESLKVMKNSQLSHVIIGSDVVLSEDVTLGEGVVYMENAGAISPSEPELNTEALTIGGSFVNDGDFKRQNELSRSDSITISGRIHVDPAHVGLSAEIIVCAAYGPLTPPSSRRKPLFYMIDTEDEFHLWDEEIANLVTFRKLEFLGEVEEIEMYTGVFDFVGVLNIYFGYRLEDGTVVYNLKTIDVTILHTGTN